MEPRLSPIANALHTWVNTPPEIAELALGPIASLPDEPFFDIVTDLLRCIDSVFFNDQCIDEAVAVGIRSELSKRLMESKRLETPGRK